METNNLSYENPGKYFLVQITTIGTPVYSEIHPEYNAGYDDIQTINTVMSEYDLQEPPDAEIIRDVKVLGELIQPYASGPELLEALQNLVHNCLEICPGIPNMLAAQEAIKNATNKSLTHKQSK